MKHGRSIRVVRPLQDEELAYDVSEEIVVRNSHLTLLLDRETGEELWRGPLQEHDQ